MKSHDDFVRNNAAERYTLGQLNEKEEILFEEHLLFCDICRKEVQGLNQIKEIVAEYATASDLVLTKKIHRVSPIGFYVKIAAGILVIIGVSWFVQAYLRTINDSHENLIVHKQNHIKPGTEPHVFSKDSVHENLMAENNRNNFTELPRFESQIGQEYRSNAI
jgi:hypothetical protein